MKYFLILMSLFFSVYLPAQENPVDIEVQPEGNITVLKYENKPKNATFAQPLKLTFKLPEVATFDGENLSQKDFEVLSVEQKKDNPLLIEATVLPLSLQASTLTALGFITKNGEKLQTEPLEINIKEIPSKIKDLIDIRGPYRPFNIWSYMFSILISVLLIYAIIRIVKRKKQVKQLNLTPYQQSERPMHEIALSQLDILIQSDLWLKNQYKLYYSEISDIVRQFLTARFNFDAQKLTAKELFKKLRTIQDFSFDFNVLKEFQRDMSLVKFAKVIPTIEERDKAISTAKEIILENKEKDLSRYQIKDDKKELNDEKVN